MVYDGVIKGDLPSIADSIARDPGEGFGRS